MSLIQVLPLPAGRFALLVEAHPDERDRFGADRTAASPLADDDSAYVTWVNQWHRFAGQIGAQGCLVSTEPITVYHLQTESGPVTAAAPVTADVSKMMFAPIRWKNLANGVKAADMGSGSIIVRHQHHIVRRADELVCDFVYADGLPCAAQWSAQSAPFGPVWAERTFSGGPYAKMLACPVCNGFGMVPDHHRAEEAVETSRSRSGEPGVVFLGGKAFQIPMIPCPACQPDGSKPQATQAT